MITGSDVTWFILFVSILGILSGIYERLTKVEIKNAPYIILILISILAIYITGLIMG